MSELVENNYSRWLHSEKVSVEDKSTLKKMAKKDKDDAFFQDIEFGTAGMRGILGPGTNRMNEFTVKKVSIAFGMYVLEKFKDAKTKGVVISHDNRFFSRQFTLETARLLNTMGVKSYIFPSLRPTPELSYAVRYLHAVGGVMITASHNPKEYNGYKVYDETGCQLVPNKIARLLDIIASLPDELTVEAAPAAESAETIELDEEVDDSYVKEVEGIQINPNLDKRGFKIVYTPQHGTSYENAMRVFKDCGYDVIPVTKQCVHDPAFGATLSPNPETAESFIEPIALAKLTGAHLIVMTDPDGDRCGVGYLSSKGTYERFTGNQSAALLMDYIFSERKKQGKLSSDGVMYDTIVTSDLGRKIARSYGLSNECFLTGFKYIGNRIDYYEKLGHGPHFEFGYEESYGCLIAPFVRDKDGIQAILLYSEMALYYHLKGIPLDVAYENLEKKYGYHFTIADSVYFEGSEGASKMKAIMEELHEKAPTTIAGREVAVVEDYLKGTRTYLQSGKVEPTGLEKAEVVKLIFADSTWVAIRPSGTEPKCKFYIEAFSKTSEGLEKEGRALLAALKKGLGIK